MNTLSIPRRPTPIAAITALVRAGQDMTMRQIAVLGAVVDRPGDGVKDVAARLALQKPIVTRALDVLVSQALVTRERSTTDGREVTVNATPAGYALVRQVEGRS
jgi:DNA-binding MarR family transcriptional regulator